MNCQNNIKISGFTLFLSNCLVYTSGYKNNDIVNDTVSTWLDDNKNNIIGVGRIHLINQVAQIRYMAIKKSHRGKGLGSKIIMELEEVASSNKIKKIPTTSWLLFL